NWKRIGNVWREFLRHWVRRCRRPVRTETFIPLLQRFEMRDGPSESLAVLAWPLAGAGLAYVGCALWAAAQEAEGSSTLIRLDVPAASGQVTPMPELHVAEGGRAQPLVNDLADSAAVDPWLVPLDEGLDPQPVAPGGLELIPPPQPLSGGESTGNFVGTPIGGGSPAATDP